MKKSICLLLAVVSFLLVTGCNEKKEEKKTCDPITGGSYNLIFETNDDNPIQNMSVCIACAPDSYEDLPVLESDEKYFEGWYYDEDFTKKVEVTNTKDINAIPITSKDDPDCITGYKNIKLYARWMLHDDVE